MADEPVDYEDLTGMQLTEDELEALVGPGGECIFNWTNKAGYPVGVVVAYLWKDGKFWTTCAARRARVPALRARPQSGVVINRDGRTASYRGDSIVHANGDDGFDELSTWFYDTLASANPVRDLEYAKAFRKFLESPHRVIIETEANLIVSFDTERFRAFTNEAILAGMAE